MKNQWIYSMHQILAVYRNKDFLDTLAIEKTKQIHPFENNEIKTKHI